MLIYATKTVYDDLDKCKPIDISFIRAVTAKMPCDRINVCGGIEMYPQAIWQGSNVSVICMGGVAAIFHLGWNVFSVKYLEPNSIASITDKLKELLASLRAI